MSFRNSRWYPLSRALAATFVVGAFSAVASADDCDVIKKAGGAQQTRPYRMLVNGREMMIHAEGVTYAHVGGAWRRMPGGPGDAALADSVTRFTDCKPVGEETVSGVRATAYTFTLHVNGLPDKRAKIWIGSDGLAYRFDPGNGRPEEFDYKNVKVPVS